MIVYRYINIDIVTKGIGMIALQKINGQSLIVNAELIETIESTPDTIIKLTTGKTFILRNSLEDVVRKIIKFKQLCHCKPEYMTHGHSNPHKNNDCNESQISVHNMNQDDVYSRPVA